MTFFGRKEEIQTLKNLKSPALVVLYGRRRVGKTSLIKEAFSDRSFFQFEGLEDQSTKQQLENFKETLFESWPKLKDGQNLKDIKFINWRYALRELNKVLKDGDVILFDEFQWMANNRTQLVSDLKMCWDQFLSKKNIILILCGSIASFMKDKVVHSKALYGRCDLTINLQPFNLEEINSMLRTQNGVLRSNDEIFETALCLGGIPKYLEYIVPYSSLHLALEHKAFHQTGELFEEYKKIFLSHFGKNSDYVKIIECLSINAYGIERKHLAKKAKVSDGGQLTKLLNDLESASFITSQASFYRKENTREIRYLLTDNYLRFYFAFIKPNISFIQKNLKNIFLNISSTPKYYSWLGKSFENMCLTNHKRIAELLGFSAVKYNVGPYFKSTYQATEKMPKTLDLLDTQGVQIDLVFDRADHVLTLCEIKYTSNPIGVEIIKEVQKKQEIIMNEFNRTVEKVLITKAPPTQDLIDKHFFNKIIRATELL